MLNVDITSKLIKLIHITFSITPTQESNKSKSLYVIRFCTSFNILKENIKTKQKFLNYLPTINITKDFDDPINYILS